MSVRRAVARPAEIDDLADAVGRYERSVLPEEIKAALRFADAFLADPGRFDADARRAVVEHFSPEQIVELVLKFIFHSGNKPTIALGFDAAIDETQLSTFRYDEQGDFVVQGLGAINREIG